MDIVANLEEIKTEDSTEEKEFYTLEEVFDRLDKKFIDFYGEYGRILVNNRRAEWNEDGFMTAALIL